MLQEKHAVTSFIESEGEVLILLRSKHVSTYQETWGGVSGVIDNDRTADEQALVEIQQETGLFGQDIELVRKGEPLVFDDEELGVRKVVHPYLFHVRDRRIIKTDWEHKELRWIRPEEIDNYKTMPKLKETLARVLSQQDGYTRR